MKIRKFSRFIILIIILIITIFLYIPRNMFDQENGLNFSNKFFETYIKTPGSHSYFLKLSFRHPTRHPYNKKNKNKYLSLTFDDGPSATYTRKILSQLKKRNIKATFFILGSRIKSNESIVKQIYKDGHEIGIHSWNHVDYTNIKLRELRLQQESTQKAITKITGKKPQLMRPPYGLWNQKVLNELEESVVLWNVDTEDWKLSNKKLFRYRCLKEIDEGDIVLMHDINSMTAGSIGYVVDKLIKKGYMFATVSDLIRIHTGKDPVKRKVYYSVN